MTGRVTEVAFRELIEIQNYIAIGNPAAANLVRARIEKTINRIFEFPFIGTEGKNYSARVFPVRPLPYLIFYTVGRREVIISNIRHAGRMRP